MNGHTLTCRRAFAALREEKGQYEAALSVGLTRAQAVGEVIHRRVPEALIPGLDQVRTAGVVTLPGAFIGVLLGGVLQVVAQWPALRAIGFANRPVLALSDPHVKEMLRRILPMTFGLGIYYVDLVLSRRFLSELPEGSQSYFYWASRICDFPQGIFVMAISTAALPSLATFAAQGDFAELSKTWAHGMRLSLFVAVPCSVALVFEQGHFDAVASHETGRALAWQGGAIFTVAAVRQLVPAFHALGDTRTPVIVSALDLVAFIVLALALRGPFGHVGVSMAIAGSSAVQMLLLFFGLRRRLSDLHLGEIGGSLARVLVASIVAGVGAWGAARILDGRRVPGLVAGSVFVVLFLVVAWGVRAPELAEVAAPIRRRLARR
jgi:putative peptidoglycan lipid II flippase